MTPSPDLCSLVGSDLALILSKVDCGRGGGNFPASKPSSSPGSFSSPLDSIPFNRDSSEGMSSLGTLDFFVRFFFSFTTSSATSVMSSRREPCPPPVALPAKSKAALAFFFTLDMREPMLSPAASMALGPDFFCFFFAEATSDNGSSKSAFTASTSPPVGAFRFLDFEAASSLSSAGFSVALLFFGALTLALEPVSALVSPMESFLAALASPEVSSGASASSTGCLPLSVDKRESNALSSIAISGAIVAFLSLELSFSAGVFAFLPFFGGAGFADSSFGSAAA